MEPFEHHYERIGGINHDELDVELRAVHPAYAGFHTVSNETVVIVMSNQEFDQSMVDAYSAAITAHNPSPTEAQAARASGVSQLVAFLDNHVPDLKYADYFYRLYFQLLQLWRDKPNLTVTTTEIAKALRGGKNTTAEMTDANHIAMYNVFLWMLPRITSVALVSGDLPASPTAVQAQAINQAAYVFAVNGVTMANMLLLNQRG